MEVQCRFTANQATLENMASKKTESTGAKVSSSRSSNRSITVAKGKHTVNRTYAEIQKHMAIHHCEFKLCHHTLAQNYAKY